MQDSKRDTAIKNRLLAKIWMVKKEKKKLSKEWVWCHERNPKDVSHLFKVVTLESNFTNASIWSFSSAMCWILSWEYWRSLYRTVSVKLGSTLLPKILVSKSPCLIYILGFQTIFHIKMFENLVYLILH